jgi:uncharacterized protein (DUF58 family)
MAVKQHIELLDPDAVGRAEALGLHARFVVEGHLAGEHRSPFRGLSVEFTQHREYVPGDDLRHLDWKVLGRTDRHYLKQYEQETNFVAHLLLDGSESMKYGSARLSKLQYGKMMAACLAYLVLHQRDAVSLTVFDQQVRQFVPRTSNSGSIHNIMTTLAQFNPAEPTRIGAVLHEAAQQIRRRGIVILVSDLFDDEEAVLDGIRHLRFGGSEVIVFHTLDAYELEFPFAGTVQFEGLENSGILKTRPHEVRRSYLREMQAFCDRLRAGCEAYHTHYVQVNTSHSLGEVLSGYLAFRRRTRR